MRVMLQPGVVCPECECEFLTSITGVPWVHGRKPPKDPDVSVGWQPTSKVGSCNSCTERGGSVLTIRAGGVNVRLCERCLLASGLSFNAPRV